ncbi:hypothetical protein A2U01_0070933, partial [Trifolium medium]|nr:hypothetical protein [Trifolium medium]
ARLATASDHATESLPSTGDYWRQLATTSPTPRPATSCDLKNGTIWRKARRTECSVAVWVQFHPKTQLHML